MCTEIMRIDYYIVHVMIICVMFVLLSRDDAHYSHNQPDWKEMKIELAQANVLGVRSP